jgi:tripartite-type tricarboxylate transporter receptor subunit TctC
LENVEIVTMFNRRSFLATAGAAGLSLTLPAFAQSGPVRIVIPFTPGTTPDTLARLMQEPLQKLWQTSVVVENKPGASGMIGMGDVARARDANALMVVSSTTTTLPFFYKTMEFDVLTSFTPITSLISSSFVLAVGKDVPVGEGKLTEFISWAKSSPNAFYGSPGNGTHHHLFMEMLLQLLDMRLTHVPYKGFAPALNDLLGGQVAAMFMPIQIAVPQRAAGRLKIIGGSLRARHPDFPDIPSLDELGAKGYDADPWYAVWGGPKVSAEQAEKYRETIIAAMNDPEVKSNLPKQGLILKTSTRDELQRMAQAEFDMWKRVIQTAQIKPE